MVPTCTSPQKMCQHSWWASLDRRRLSSSMPHQSASDSHRQIINPLGIGTASSYRASRVPVRSPLRGRVFRRHRGRQSHKGQPTPRNSRLSGRNGPDVRVVVYDHSFTDDPALFRFAFKWSDPKTGEPRTRAGKSYRIEGGKLAETWITWCPLGHCMSDAVVQARWTSKRRA